MPRLNKSRNLKVFLRTVLTGTQRSTNGDIESVTVVQRTPVDPSKEYSAPLSEELLDWYSPVDSSSYTKKVFNLTGKVLPSIQAAELLSERLWKKQ
eukprot:m.98202 g.98202  ORF g.98202 m.98202 type:complete len:96 (-) comp14860_c0_seq2:39-326(-)